MRKWIGYAVLDQESRACLVLSQPQLAAPTIRSRLIHDQTCGNLWHADRCVVFFLPSPRQKIWLTFRTPQAPSVSKCFGHRGKPKYVCNQVSLTVGET